MPAYTTINVSSSGSLQFGDHTCPCALGRSGVQETKVEGDGVTPIGTYALRSVLYRPDRVDLPQTNLPTAKLGTSDGWCDDPGLPDYNRPITFPFKGSAEQLWREDHLYDVIVVLGQNDDPVVPGAGSAIFMHVAADGYAATEGCVALALEDLLAVLSGCDQETRITISLDN